MDMHWLDDVLMLLEERNMTRAAARRNITQPAFSRRIRSFEDWLGIEVLDRKTNRIEISPALVQNEEEIRALVARLTELRTKIVHHDPEASLITIAGQHAPVSSSFPDMALRARVAFPSVRFRMRSANLNDCVTQFVRGDTSMLLCHEVESVGQMHFGADVMRRRWGQDYLIPVVGGNLRYSVRDNRDIPAGTPAIVYPDSSYFGQALAKNQRMFATAGQSANPVCQTAFSGGMREMVLGGLGVGWLPYSMVHKEIESGEAISLAIEFGQEPLDIAIYARRRVDMACKLAELWGRAP